MSELEKERQASAERDADRKREQLREMRARLCRRKSAESGYPLRQVVESEYGHLSPEARDAIMELAESDDAERRVRRTRARWLLDEYAQLGGEPTTDALSDLALREWPDEPNEEVAEIVRLARALDQGAISGAEVDDRPEIPSKRMVELASDYFVENPDATSRAAYDWIAENYGPPAIKLSSWTSNCAPAAKRIAARRSEPADDPEPEPDDVESPDDAPETDALGSIEWDPEVDPAALDVSFCNMRLVAFPVDENGTRWDVAFVGHVDATTIRKLIAQMIGGPFDLRIKPKVDA